MIKTYDISIIGAGPAGLSAGIYSSRAGLKTAIFEKGAPGGQISWTSSVENYPGFPQGVLGPDLSEKFRAQAAKFGCEFINNEILSIQKAPDASFLIKGLSVQCISKTVIIAAGSVPNKLGIPGESEFLGKGVSTCGTCDGPLFRGKNVFAIGGGDTAVDESLFISKFASAVTIIHRRDKLRASAYLEEKAKNNGKISFLWNTIPLEIKGGSRVEGITVKNKVTGTITEHKTDGVFVFIGQKPNSRFVRDMVKTDDEGYIAVNLQMETSVPGMFACGDIREKSYKQVAISTGDGATAALSAQKYIEKK
ncbi:thioredoxin-disulfide reductase [bacterium]|jgi:thioredoxin reductase (NADPH)|nr:thioredoxin-disulfide reductase [bacterium]